MKKPKTVKAKKGSSADYELDLAASNVLVKKNSVSLKVNTQLYSSSVLARSADDFSKKFDVSINEDGRYWRVSITPKGINLTKQDLNLVGLEFFNYLISAGRGGFSDDFR